MRGPAEGAESPPRLASGRYELLGRLGAGASSQVYAAFDRERQERVALKALRRLEPEAVLAFKREFRTMVGLQHENIVELYDLFAGDGAWFFTMELLAGRPLLEHVRGADGAGPAEAEARLRGAFAQLCQGLLALHGAGLLHRDVKPDNVLVEPDGRVVLVDFGLVGRLRPSRLLPGEGDAMSGTPRYMAPEQCCGEPVTAASDWYAVGVMLFEALTGRAPFEGDGLAIIDDKLTRVAPRASEVRAGVPPDLDALCAALLAADPAERPSGEACWRCLAGGDAPTPAAPGAAGPPSLVGRGPQLEALWRAFEAARAGAATIVAVRGRSGMGKSAVLEQFLEEAAARGATVLSGRCREHEALPFKAVDSLVDALADRLAALDEEALAAALPPDAGALVRLFPALRHVPPLGALGAAEAEAAEALTARSQAFSVLRELLRRLAAEAPLVLAIDDVQWDDEDSAALVLALLEPPATPLLLALGVRDESAGESALLAALRPFGPLGVELAPLEPADARALVAALLGRPDDDSTVGALTAAAAGSPFYLEQFARHARDAGPSAAALSLEGVLRARLDALAPPARALLEAVAVAHRPLAPGLAAAAAGLAEPEAGRALRSLRAAHLLRYHAGASAAASVEASHDRVREAVVAALAPAARRARHAALADALAARGVDDPETLFVHCREAGRRSQALDHALAAAARAGAALAFDHAAHLYAEARALLPADPWRADARRARLAYVEGAKNAFLAGDEAGAGALFAAAEAGAPTTLERASAAALWAVLENARGRPREAIERECEALRSLGLGHMRPRPNPLRLLWGLGRIRWRLGRMSDDELGRLQASTDLTHLLTVKTLLEAASPAFFVDQRLMGLVAVEAFAHILDRGTTPATPLAFTYMAVLLLHILKDGRGAARVVRFALRQLDEAGGPVEYEGRLRHTLGAMVLPWVGPMPEAQAQLDRAVNAATASGDLAFFVYAVIMRAIHSVVMGVPLDQTAELVARHADQVVRTRYVESVDALALFAWALRSLRGPSPALAAFDGPGLDEGALFERTKRYPTRTVLHQYYLLKQLVLYVRGDYEAGLAVAEASAPDVHKDVFGHVQPADHDFLYALFLAAAPPPAARRARAARLVRQRLLARRLARVAAMAPRDFAHKHALVAAELARAVGRHDAAERHYGRAIEGARAAGSLRDEAFAAERAAGHARARGQAERARELEARARAAYDGWGLRPSAPAP